MIATIDTRGSTILPSLSKRQEQCLRGVLELRSAKEIARDLGISPHMVEKHLRAAREKFGVGSSAEAARLFAAAQQGYEFPHYGMPDLAAAADRRHVASVPEGSAGAEAGHLGDSNGAPSLDRPLSPRQTLLAIALVSFGSIVGLLLLVACAEGIRSLVSR